MAFATIHGEPMRPPSNPSFDRVGKPATLVSIRRYRDLSEAIVARSLIESTGIFCFLQDENFARLKWQASNLIGGIRLQVPDEDAEAAIEILDQPIPANFSFEGVDDYQQPCCPQCQSVEISFERSTRKAALASLYMFALPVPLGASSWFCNQCACRWTDDADT
jgi:hypothetical protein